MAKVSKEAAIVIAFVAGLAFLLIYEFIQALRVKWGGDSSEK